jgi:putative hemin transport protein
MTNRTTDLRSQWSDLLLANPKLRIRDATDVMKVSEAELLTTCCGETVTRLAGNWSSLGALVASLPGQYEM